MRIRLSSGGCPVDPNNPATFNNSTSTTIYDSLGGATWLRCISPRAAANAWNAYLTVDGASVRGCYCAVDGDDLQHQRHPGGASGSGDFDRVYPGGCGERKH